MSEAGKAGKRLSSFRVWRGFVVGIGALLIVGPAARVAGFDFTRHAIPPEEIVSGGPPKDGIPAIFAPEFVPAARASFLQPDDRVIGVALAGDAAAYPIRILNWHEAVNDTIGGVPVAVTYCPLTDTALVFDRRAAGRTLSFGISGRLYRSNVLLYDRQTESLWSQLREQAVTGPMTGTRLRLIPSVVTAWKRWRKEHPDTRVLSTRTGHRRDYGRDPYAGYRRSPQTMFPPGPFRPILPPKTRVFGLRMGSVTRAWPLQVLRDRGEITENLGGSTVRVVYDAAADSAHARDARTGRLLPGYVAYWFAWSSFHPRTTVLEAKHVDTGRLGAPTGEAVSAKGVEIVEHSAYWTEVFGLGGFGGLGAETSGDPSVLVIRGRLRNISGRVLRWVRLEYELLDARGRVVAQEVGYNRASEQLRPLDSPVPVSLPTPAAAPPIPPGDEDTFRMVFLGDETPAFRRYRVRVADATPGPPVRLR